MLWWKCLHFRYTLCAPSSKNYTCKCVRLELHRMIHTAGDYTKATTSCLIGSEKQYIQSQADQNWPELIIIILLTFPPSYPNGGGHGTHSGQWGLSRHLPEKGLAFLIERVTHSWAFSALYLGVLATSPCTTTMYSIYSMYYNTERAGLTGGWPPSLATKPTSSDSHLQTF